MTSVNSYSHLYNIVNNNTKINNLLNEIGKQKKSLKNKVTFKKSKSKELLEILERKISEFLTNLSFDNLKEKLLELQKISEKINLTMEKIVVKKDDTLNKDFLDIFEKYRLLFPAFSDQILVFFEKIELNIDNLTYLSSIIDNLILIYLKIFYLSNKSKSYLVKDLNYGRMLEAQKKISDKIINISKNKKELKTEDEELEILKKELSEFLTNLTFDNLAEKLLELQKISKKINLTREKIFAKNDEILKLNFLSILNQYRKLFPYFSKQISVLLNKNELNIKNLTYVSFIIDNLTSLYLKIFYSSNNSHHYYNKDSDWKEMEIVTKEISDKIDKMPKVNINNSNNLSNEYILREKIFASSIEIYKKALKSKGKELQELKRKLQELIELYKQKFINSRQNQVFPLNQNTLNNLIDNFSNLNKNNSLATNLSELSLNFAKK